MSNICAGIEAGQMLVLDNHVNKRRDVNKFSQAEKFNDINGVKIHNEPSIDYFSRNPY